MPRISIRAKLLLLSVAMLGIPYVGFQFLRETERYLQGSLEDSLSAVSAALGSALENQSGLFRDTSNRRSGAYPLFVHALRYPIHLDGYADEWENYAAWVDRFDYPKIPRQAASRVAGFDLLVGEHGQNLNLLIRVDDEDRVYQRAGEFAPGSADTIELVFRSSDGDARSVYLGTAGPGPVTAYGITENWDFSQTRTPLTNIFGEWRETANGFTVEVRIPLFLATDAIGVVIHDADARATTISVGSYDKAAGGSPNALLRTSAQLERIVKRVGFKKGRRIWILNRSGQVLASVGSLTNEAKRGAINILYTWILPAATSNFEDDLKTASRLRGEEVLRALGGEASTRWRSSPDERAVIVSAAHPVRSGNELMGAIVVEETTNTIQTLQRDAMASLFNQSIAVFFGVSLILLLFASRLSFRIGKLRDQAERSIDSYGRVVGEISANRASDELGDLSRSFSAMLRRLAEYNAYLESMASKLSHELRTPLTVVSSSLENLSTLEGTSAEPYLARAQEGMARLHSLVSRLSEAARLEQSVANVEFSEFDLVELTRGCVEGYRLAYSSRDFKFVCEPQACAILGSDELIAQLLDKLIDNAVSFGDPRYPIEITLSTSRHEILVSVTNSGSLLPAEMQSEIFNSMISLRQQRAEGEPHLGLGLFIARLIAEAHGGQIAARNLADDSGVVFELTLPR